MSMCYAKYNQMVVIYVSFITFIILLQYGSIDWVHVTDTTQWILIIVNM